MTAIAHGVWFSGGVLPILGTVLVDLVFLLFTYLLASLLAFAMLGPLLLGIGSDERRSVKLGRSIAAILLVVMGGFTVSFLVQASCLTVESNGEAILRNAVWMPVHRLTASEAVSARIGDCRLGRHEALASGYGIDLKIKDKHYLTQDCFGRRTEAAARLEEYQSVISGRAIGAEGFIRRRHWGWIAGTVLFLLVLTMALRELWRARRFERERSALDAQIREDSERQAKIEEEGRKRSGAYREAAPSPLPLAEGPYATRRRELSQRARKAAQRALTWISFGVPAAVIAALYR